MEDNINNSTNQKETFTRGKTLYHEDTSTYSLENNGWNKLNSFNWLNDIPKQQVFSDLVEIRFKNTRKGLYRNVNELILSENDIVAVEANPGHDIGIVSQTGELVIEKIRKNNYAPSEGDIKKIYRKVKISDLKKWKEAIDLEIPTMLEARQIAFNLNLDMKIGDVEYQGDKTKAIFYYIADERVDFRELIKHLAEKFKVRIEMKQIGARQEAGRIGGIGACGRELCCASWMSIFVSVSTSSARCQELSLNPQKLAGQCSKLKCCLNYEVSCYLDAQKDFPDTSIMLETKDGKAEHKKTDIHRRIMWYANENDKSGTLYAISVDRVREIIEWNKTGKLIENLIDKGKVIKTQGLDYETPLSAEIPESLIDRTEKKSNKRNHEKKNWQRRNHK